MAVVVSFRDEQRHLPTLLASIAAQTLPPELLLLVDDGSEDTSPAIARCFCERHAWARLICLPREARGSDRLADAAELSAFQRGVAEIEASWDILAKIDADLRLNPDLFAAVRSRFAADPALGITGSYLSVEGCDGHLRREHRPPDHVLGPNKFYRRDCFEQISPLPLILGWDTIDDLRARMRGWSTESFALESGESVHLRPMGAHDGRLRAFHRWGRCAWGYGSHPLWVLLGGVYRARQAPYALGGASYVLGWLSAAAHRAPRAERQVREQARQEELSELYERLLDKPCEHVRSFSSDRADHPRPRDR